MTPAQQAAFFCALPFLALSIAWIAGLAYLTPRVKPVPVKKERRVGQ